MRSSMDQSVECGVAWWQNVYRVFGGGETVEDVAHWPAFNICTSSQICSGRGDVRSAPSGWKD
jgi:hypothetical protein